MKFLLLILVLQAAAFWAIPMANSTSPEDNDVFAQKYMGIFYGLLKERIPMIIMSANRDFKAHKIQEI